MRGSAPVLVGVDTGGTFTDVITLDQSGRARIRKVETDHRDLAAGIVRSLRESARGQTVVRLAHGTTIATNAVLENKGARTALLTTAGFEDVLEIGRFKRSNLYDLQMDAETPGFVVPRHLRIGIPERVDAQGRVVRPLQRSEVQRATDYLGNQGVEAVVVSYLFSFLNPTHEQQTREWLHSELPDVHVSLSSDIDPVFREYERLCVTAFNGYVGPVIQRYLTRLGREAGAEVEVMQSRGSVREAEEVAQRPVTTLLSGPAAGVVAASWWARAVGRTECITFDMGGTSTDVGTVLGGEPQVWREGRIGSYPLRLPMVAVTTIGAGGGSIASRNAAGELRVGPRSAGSRPGPACYGKGGDEPTVTDASVALGYLNPLGIGGGSIHLREDLALKALASLGNPLEVAKGIHRIVNARMADHLRLATVRRGLSPKELALLAYGGAGPMHALALARDLGIEEVIIPAHPGVLCAEGLLLAPSEREYTHSAKMDVSEVPDVIRRFRERSRGEPEAAIWADMRYRGQSYELAVRADGPSDLRNRFEEQHAALYGYRNVAAEVEVMALRFVVRRREGEDILAYDGARPLREAESRRCWFPETGWVDSPVFARADLEPGSAIPGPFLVDQLDTTVVVPPAAVAVQHDTGAMVIRP